MWLEMVWLEMVQPQRRSVVYDGSHLEDKRVLLHLYTCPLQRLVVRRYARITACRALGRRGVLRAIPVLFRLRRTPQFRGHARVWNKVALGRLEALARAREADKLPLETDKSIELKLNL